MRNSKRDLNGYSNRLGRYRLSRKNIMILEKIIWEYADAREMKYVGALKLPDGRKHMPRRFADRRVAVGEHYADSVKFLPRSINKTRYMEVACKPGITITFTPLSTRIYAQTNYATGNEKKAMMKSILSIEEYLTRLPRTFLNTISLSKDYSR